MSDASRIVAEGAGLMLVQYDSELRDRVREAGKLLAAVCHAQSVWSGWHKNILTGEAFSDSQNDEKFPMRIALIHSELSEALEGHRRNAMDDKLPWRPAAEVELADALIRICDLAEVMGYQLGDAVAAKLLFNAMRKDHQLESRQDLGGKKY